jgi:hypothetical protein
MHFFATIRPGQFVGLGGVNGPVSQGFESRDLYRHFRWNLRIAERNYIGQLYFEIARQRNRGLR